MAILYGLFLQGSTVSDLLMSRGHFRGSCPRLVHREQLEVNVSFDEKAGVVGRSDNVRYVVIGILVLRTIFGGIFSRLWF